MRMPLRRGCRLIGAEGALLVRAFIWIILIDLALRAFGFARVSGWTGRGSLAKPSEPTRGDSSAFERARRYAHWIDVAADHHIIRARCLHRSLTLHQWL